MSLGAIGVLLAVVLHGCASQPAYSGPPSDHFDGMHFSNALPADKSLLDIAQIIVSFYLNREPWPEWVQNGSYPSAPNDEAAIVATFINHSTVLLRIDGVNVLTDPIYAERASPFSFLGPRRVREPGLALDALPPLDAVIVSHDHYDHLDVEALRALRGAGRGNAPLTLAGLGNDALFADHGIEPARTLDWGERVRHAGLDIEFVEVRHRSGRGLASQMKTLWGGYVIESRVGRIYFAGDTGYGPHFSAAREAYGAFDLCLLPIGAYRPRWFMGPVHLDPEQAVQAHQDLGCRQSIAIHHGTFQLTYEGIDEPYEALTMALETAGLSSDEFKVLGFGESLRLARAQLAAQAALRF